MKKDSSTIPNKQPSKMQQAQDLSKAILAANGFMPAGMPRMLEINGVTRAVYNGVKK